MSTDGKTLSVSEFAKKAGISRQRVYKLLTGKLSTYCQRVDNQIMLDSSALSLFDVNGVDTETVNGLTSVVNGVDKGLTSTDTQTDTQSGGAAELAALDVLRGVVEGHADEIERLRAELAQERQRREAAELTSARLTAERDAEHHRFRDASAERDRLAEIVSRLTTTIQADAAARAIAAKESTTTEAITDGEADPPKKKGFFKRLFSHKT